MAEVGCAGILVADMFCGPMERLPRAGELLAIDSLPSKAGGCAANVAIDLAKQGVDVDVAGCIGRDAPAKVLLTYLEEHRVGCRHLAYTDTFPTSQTVILLVKGEDRRYIHMFGANGAFTVEQIDRDWVAGLKLFYLGGLFAMPGIRTEPLRDLLAFCRRKKIITVVDVVIPQGFSAAEEMTPLLPHVDYLLPNNEEGRQLTGCAEPEDQLRALLAGGVGTVVVTLGKDGALAGRGGKFWRCGAHRMDVIDPSGSGDAFAAGIVAGAIRGWDVPQTLRYASALGASATQAIGTTDGVFRAAQTESFVEKNPLEVVHGLLGDKAS